MNALAERLLDESGEPMQEAIDAWREELEILDDIFEEEESSEDEQIRDESSIRLQADRQRTEHRRAVIGILVSEIHSERLTLEWVLNEGLQDDTMDALAERLLDESGETIQEAMDAWREELESFTHNNVDNNNDDVIENLNRDLPETDNILDSSETTYIADEINRLALLNEFDLRHL